MTHVKICGCMRMEDALAARDAGADFYGLVFAPRSRRRLSIEAAREIVDALGGRAEDIDLPPSGDGVDAWFPYGAGALERTLRRRRPLAVGVFEDQPIEEVDEIAEAVGLDLVQLSGRESWADAGRPKRPVVKAVAPPDGASAADVIAGLQTGPIACMLDVSRGRGVALDRAVATGVAARMPIWLAGGLAPENVAEVVRDVRPWAVDVSSGVETDGVKDADKMRAFVTAAKGALVS